MLLRAPYRVSFADAGKDGAWKGNWHDRATLPSAVRLTVRDPATDRVLPLSTVAVVRADLPAECAGGDCDKFRQKKKKVTQPQSDDSDRRGPRSE